MHTRRFDTLTYARSGTEAEDITVFDRKKHRNISVYPSKSEAGVARQLPTTKTTWSTTTSSTATSTCRPRRTGSSSRAARGCLIKVRSCALQHHHAEARRAARRPVHHQQRAGAAVRGADQRTRTRSSSTFRWRCDEGFDADADGDLRRPSRVAERRSRGRGAGRARGSVRRQGRKIFR